MRTVPSAMNHEGPSTNTMWKNRRGLPKAGLKMVVLLGFTTCVLAACGGDQKGVEAPKPAPQDAGPPDAVAPQAAVPFASSNVPMAEVAPTFRYGSRKAEKKAVSPPPCADPGGADPRAQAGAFVHSCGDKMRPLGPPQAGTQAETAPAQPFKLKAEGGHCYRFYAGSARTVKNLVVVVTDSTGAIAWESRSAQQDGPAHLVAPEDGVLCFKSSDDALVTVSVGSGAGPYTLQIVGD